MPSLLISKFQCSSSKPFFGGVIDPKTNEEKKIKKIVFEKMVTLGQPVSNELELCSMLFLFSKVGLDLGLADATYKLL